MNISKSKPNSDYMAGKKANKKGTKPAKQNNKSKRYGK
jgi:hypothetical protein